MTSSLPNTARAFANCDDHDVETEKGLSSRARYFRDRCGSAQKGPGNARWQVGARYRPRRLTALTR